MIDFPTGNNVIGVANARVQTCPRSVHADWLTATDQPLPCPWCQIEQRDIELDIANNEIGQMRDGER